MSQNRKLLATSDLPNLEQIEQQVAGNLAQRLAASSKYSEEEIQEISGLSSSLFPKDFELDLETGKSMRALCCLSQCSLTPEHKIQSHRPFIGPIIVGFKRFIWRFIKGHLNETLDGIQEQQSWMVYSHAQQLVRIKKLENKA